ncbi:MAG: hypothetical protein LBU07_06320 [Coriobacteriales bacterium]|jgi:hypothetical protein|nr:hypothetical protein [Coriobacteriales bacterium]
MAETEKVQNAKALAEELKTLSAELSEDELAKVAGGVTTSEINAYYRASGTLFDDWQTLNALFEQAAQHPDPDRQRYGLPDPAVAMFLANLEMRVHRWLLYGEL